MAESMDIPLPELTVENFKRAWTRFELVAKAKEWNAAKQLIVLPTLLRGKLVDYYTEFDDDTKGDISKIRLALAKASGRVEDPLVAARTFVSRDQGPDERVEDFANDLKRLFKQAYPSEDSKSSVLLQRFLTGLRASISQQLLLRKKPEDLAEAIEGAIEVEYALAFDGGRSQNPKDVNLVQPPPKPLPSEDQLIKLQEAIGDMTKRMEALESTLTAERTANRTGSSSTSLSPGPVGSARRNNRNRRPVICFRCNKEGHIRRNCPLNYAGPAQMAGSWPGRF